MRIGPFPLVRAFPFIDSGGSIVHIANPRYETAMWRTEQGAAALSKCLLRVRCFLELNECDACAVLHVALHPDRRNGASKPLEPDDELPPVHLH